MSSQWTSKYAIMRDLSLAQGCDVPATLDATVGADEKPPAPNILEDTEEEYFRNWLGDGDASGPPDLNLIQQMLHMVRDTNSSSDCANEPDIYEITKPQLKITLETNNNIDMITFESKNKIVQNTVPKKPKKKRENVAVNSILEAIASDIPISNMEKPSEPLKLLKPTDFMSTEKEIVDSVEKVNGWLDSQQQLLANMKPSNKIMKWEPGSMFKRKSSSTVKSTESDSIKSSPQQKAAAPTTSYQPSNLANEYYQKFVERSKMKEIVNEDVWSKAERMMKEIEAEKKVQMKAFAEAEAEGLEPIDNSQSTLDAEEKFEKLKSVAEIQLGCPRPAPGGE